MARQNSVHQNAVRMVRLFVRTLGEDMLLDYSPRKKIYTLHQNKVDYSEFTRPVIIHREGWTNITNGFFEYNNEEMIEVFKGYNITQVITKVGGVEWHKLIISVTDREERYGLMNLEDEEMARFLEKISLLKKWRLYLPPA